MHTSFLLGFSRTSCKGAQIRKIAAQVQAITWPPIFTWLHNLLRLVPTLEVFSVAPDLLNQTLVAYTTILIHVIPSPKS